jgi:hypothetical protein
MWKSVVVILVWKDDAYLTFEVNCKENKFINLKKLFSFLIIMLSNDRLI